MRRLFFSLIVCLLSVSLFPGTAFAQRTANNQFHLYGSVDYNLNSMGGEVQFGQYLLFGYWSAGANLQNYAYRTSEVVNEFANFQRIVGLGTFMYRFFGNRSRSLNFYGRGDVFAGAEVLDMFSSLSKAKRKNLVENVGFSEARFVFGGGLRLEGEYFPLPRLAIILPVRVSFTANTAMKDVVGFNVGLGVRYNF